MNVTRRTPVATVTLVAFCLGAPLARAEGEIAFATLLRRYPDLRLAIPVEELVWRENFLRGFREIPVRF